MATESITVIPYTGSVIPLNLLGSSRTLVLSDFGSPVMGELLDNDGTLSISDTDSTFNGELLTYIGSGTFQPGASVLGIFVPLGSPVPVGVFVSGGQTYFYYPEGEPNFLGNVIGVLSLTPTPLEVFAPVCFSTGTLISTPNGDVPVEALSEGDFIIDINGDYVKITWIERSNISLTNLLQAERRKVCPVVIPQDAFGDRCPYQETRLSPQHKVYFTGFAVELCSGMQEVLVPAINLVGDFAHQDLGTESVEYFHILCDDRRIILANGLPCETLYPGEATMQILTNRAASSASLPPDLMEFVYLMDLAFPTMKQFETSVMVNLLKQSIVSDRNGGLTR